VPLSFRIFYVGVATHLRKDYSHTDLSSLNGLGHERETSGVSKVADVERLWGGLGNRVWNGTEFTPLSRKRVEFCIPWTRRRSYQTEWHNEVKPLPFPFQIKQVSAETLPFDDRTFD
jgi:hypothetical protein